MMYNFCGGWGGSSKIGQNRTSGVGSLAKIGRPHYSGILAIFSTSLFTNFFV